MKNKIEDSITIIIPEPDKQIKKLLLINQHTCPWWLIFSFDNPLRYLNPILTLLCIF